MFVGLGFEIGPEAWGYVITSTRLPRELFGSALVAIGVFAEVALGIFIARSSKRQEMESNKRIAELNERAAELNAEIERLRKDNHQMALLLSNRSISDLRELERTMKPFAGTKFAFDVHSFAFGPNGEAHNLYLLLHNALYGAGWIKVREPSRRTQLGPGVAIATIASRVPSPRADPAIQLAKWLHRDHISVVQIVGTDAALEPGTVVIAVGPKPETLEQLRMLDDSYKLWPRTTQP